MINMVKKCWHMFGFAGKSSGGAVFFNQNITSIKVKIYAVPPKLKDRRFFIFM